MTAAQRMRLLELRARLAGRDGRIVEIREAAGFVGVTVRGSGLRADDGDVELFVLPDGRANVGQLAVPEGDQVSWETIEQDQRRDQTQAAPGS